MFPPRHKSPQGTFSSSNFTFITLYVIGTFSSSNFSFITLCHFMSFVYKYSRSRSRWHFRKLFQSSKLEARTSPSLKRGKRHVRVLSFELWKSFRKCQPRWGRLYILSYTRSTLQHTATDGIGCIYSRTRCLTMSLHIYSRTQGLQNVSQCLYIYTLSYTRCTQGLYIHTLGVHKVSTFILSYRGIQCLHNVSTMSLL